ncbi:potassium channel family protein [Alteromonas macleodii]
MNPFSDVHNYLWGKGKNETSKATKLHELEVELARLYDEISALENEEFDKRKELEKAEVIEKSAIEKLSKEREQEIESYRNSQLAFYEDTERNYLTKIAELEKSLKGIADPISRYPVILKLEDLRVGYSTFRVEKAKKAYEVSSYIVDNYGTFGSAVTVQKINKLHDDQIKLLDQISEAQNAAGDARQEAGDLVRSAYEDRKARVGYVDFLYFSVGISTTTTFGDIVANSKIARAFVGIQLLICIVIVGVFLSHIIGQGANKQTHAD